MRLHFFPCMQDFFTDSSSKLVEFQELIASPKRIVITTHQNPDGDAMGSSLGLAHFLSEKKHQVTVITPTDYPEFLRWLPADGSTVINYESQQKDKAEELIATADMIFCLDFSVLNRIKDMENSVRNASAIKVLVDHHQQPENFADFVYWHEHAAATCQLIYELIEKLGESHNISKQTAECLYTGLITDTGSFRFDSTSKDVHRIAGELLERGVNPNRVHRNLFESNQFSRLRLLGYALTEKMVHLPEYRVAYCSLSKEDLLNFNSNNGDTEGIVNFGLSIKDVVMSAIFIERDGLVKISFRSVEDFSVSELSRQNFEGGGHKNAAGGRSNQTLEETINKFLALLPNYKEALLAI